MPETDRPTVGFIGLGNLGLPMVERLLDDGFEVAAVDVDEGRSAAAAQAGARTCPTPDGLGSVDVLCVCVVDDAQVEEVVLGDSGALDGLPSGATIAVHSTIFPDTVDRVAAAAREHGVEVLDAPVSGGDRAARAGTLAVMVGGESGGVDRARPVLESVGEHVFHVGAQGSGLAAKFANQLMTFANQAAALEAVRLAAAFGVDEQQVLEVARAGTADSWCLRNWGFFDRVAGSYEEAGSPPRNRPWRKDMWDVVTVARQMELSLPIAGLIGQVAPESIDERGRGGG